jgi:2-dehydro-3-deoxyglucarate aldolase/4-hydroxy-2-oxoheptanedioate aldolase
MMRENNVKRSLARGDVSIGTMCLEFNTPGLGRICATAGAEFAVFDMEHSGWSIETIRMLMATTRCTDMVPLVRPPTNEYHLIAPVLDMGAMGIVIPFVSTADQAKRLVASCKYPPAGRRGTAFGVAHDDYTTGDIPAKMKGCNDEVLVVAQIETMEGVENVEQIASVEGVDVVWIGQFDLTTSMGIPGQVKHPDFLRVSKRILDACHSAGKAAGFGSLLLDDVLQAREEGFRFLVYTADLWIFQQALRRGLRKIRTGRDEE